MGHFGSQSGTTPELRDQMVELEGGELNFHKILIFSITAVNIFFILYKIKKCKWKITVMLLLFLKKIRFGSLRHSGQKNDASAELCIGFKDFFKIFQNENSQEICENYINSFSQINLIQVNLEILGPKLISPYYSRFFLRMFFLKLVSTNFYLFYDNPLKTMKNAFYFI